jgi:hypothetical protein
MAAMDLWITLTTMRLGLFSLLSETLGSLQMNGALPQSWDSPETD